MSLQLTESLVAPMPWRMKARHKSAIGLFVLFAVLVAARVALPYLVRDEINKQMAHLGPYRGQVADVEIHLWRGAYTLNGMLIEKGSGKVPVPLMKAPHIDLSVSWSQLFHGAVVAEVTFDRPEFNLVDGRSEADSQSGRGVDWRAELDRLLPIQLNEVRVHDGTVAFRAFNTKPAVDLKATDVQATILNLTNVRGESGKRVAEFEASAKVLGEAPMATKASFDPFGTLDDFDFNVRVTSLELAQLNPLLQAYARIDVASGEGEFLMELQATESQLSGYAKPMFRDLKVLSWQQDVVEQHDNPARLLWEAFAGGTAWIFKNQRADQFATRIPISGNLKKPQTGKLDALLAILRNAFVEAFQPQFEQDVGRAARADHDP
jgi:hypothetical protein